MTAPQAVFIYYAFGVFYIFLRRHNFMKDLREQKEEEMVAFAETYPWVWLVSALIFGVVWLPVSLRNTLRRLMRGR